MNKGWKWFGLLLVCTALCLGLAQTVFADGEAILIQGVDIIADSDQTIECGSGTAHYNPATSTLTLENVTLSPPSSGTIPSRAIKVQNMDNLTIRLIGTNVIEAGTSSDNGLDAETVNLTIIGDDKETSRLTVTASQGIALYCQELTIKNVSLDLTASGTLNGCGIMGSGTIDIENADIEIHATCSGIMLSNGSTSMTVTDSALKIISDDRDCIYGGAPLMFIRSTLDLSSDGDGSGEHYDYPALYSQEGITFQDCQSVKVSGSWDSICGASISIQNSTIEANSSKFYGIYTNQLSITGNSEVIAFGGTKAVHASQSLSVTPPSGSAVQVMAGADAVSATPIAGSPFSVQTDVKDLVGEAKYFHSLIEGATTSTPHTYTIVRRDGYLTTGEEYWAEPPKEEAVGQPDAGQPTTDLEAGKDNPSMGGLPLC